MPETHNTLILMSNVHKSDKLIHTQNEKHAFAFDKTITVSFKGDSSTIHND